MGFRAPLPNISAFIGSMDATPLLSGAPGPIGAHYISFTLARCTKLDAVPDFAFLQLHLLTLKTLIPNSPNRQIRHGDPYYRVLRNSGEGPVGYVIPCSRCLFHCTQNCYATMTRSRAMEDADPKFVFPPSCPYSSHIPETLLEILCVGRISQCSADLHGIIRSASRRRRELSQLFVFRCCPAC